MAVYDNWVSRWFGRLPLPLVLLLLASAAALPYLNILHGRYVYDDKVAVSGNPDVYRAEVPLSTIMYHDFWGNKLFTDGTGGWTHHSWRPLVVLSFRLDWWIGRGSTEPFHIANWCYHIAAVWTAFATALAIFGATARRRRTVTTPLQLAGDRSSLKEADATKEHVEAEDASDSTEAGPPAVEKHEAPRPPETTPGEQIEEPTVRLVTVSAGESATDVAADETGSNDLLMASDSSPSPFKAVKHVSFQVNNKQNAPQHRNNHNKHNRGQRDSKSQRPAAKRQPQATSVLPPVTTAVVAHSLANEQDSIVQQDEEEDEEDVEEAVASRGIAVLSALIFALHPIHTECVANITSRADTIASVFQLGAIAFYAHSVRRPGEKTQKGWQTHVALFIAEHLCMLIALMCKETTLIVPALCVCVDIAAAMGRAALRFKDAEGKVSVRSGGQYMWLLLTEMPYLKVFIHLGTGVVIYYLRIIVMAQGYQLHTWANPIHNSLYHIEGGPLNPSKVMSIAFVQAFALSKLVVPVFLSHEHNAMQHILSISDGRNILTLVVWILLVALIVACLAVLAAGACKQSRPSASSAYRVLYGLAFVAVSYFPSSHMVQYVAFVLAERTLFLPSFGAGIVLAELASWCSSGFRAFQLQTPMSNTRSSKYAGFSVASFLLLFIYYIGRTWTRNIDWLNEELLMASNLALYPVNNTMTVYGLGAVALYKGELEVAEAHLKRAIVESSMVEPRILLSQLYWKFYTHHVFEDGKTGMDKAQEELELIASSHTPRKEIFTNLGLLQYQRNPTDNESLYMAERYVLVAHGYHGYPEGHFGTAVLNSNAGCIRLMSQLTRFGHANEAEHRFVDALRISRDAGSPTAFRNAALFYAVQGQSEQAYAIIEEGMELLEANILGLSGPSEIGNKDLRAATINHHLEVFQALKRLKMVLNVFQPITVFWRNGNRVVGDEALERMNMLGLDCHLELLWW